MNDENRQKIEIFISYAHEDEDLLNKLVSHLSQLKRDGLIETWHDRRLTGGQEWAGQIDDHLENAHIVLLLISADFIDSKYCYDIEMKRALDRHNNHEARVIPVILRPTDWRNAPFGKLQALPRDGRPVVKFETLDDGFLEVAQGLRNIVSQWNVNIPLTPGSVDIPEFPPPKRPWKIKALLIAALIIVLLAGTGAFWNHYRQIVAIEGKHLANAEKYMRAGRYSEAKDEYQQAQKVRPRSKAAGFGLEKATLPEVLAEDKELFSLKLNSLLNLAPDDPDLLIMDGDRHYFRGEKGLAVGRYRKVATQYPMWALAHFRLGVISDQSGDVQAALAHYQNAVDIAPDTDIYRSNLAYVYFKQADYDHAIAEYRKIPQSPLAALEWAKAALMQGDVNTVLEEQKVALNWLEDDQVATLQKNQGTWYFEVDNHEGVRVFTRSEKLCYTKLALSATLFLSGHPVKAQDYFQSAKIACPAVNRVLLSILETDLVRAKEAQPQLADRIEDYRRQFLSN
ncbi:conserved hypothetical protein [Desulfosarcina cetonica]|nr:conserved hypothetical protein [Desulfosarcina cetonica]